ncbi:T9SS type A sorting domain-containing protein [Chryseobacterium sp. JJR-5R]|uniref:T9SS type A sorting domain-containing protein n=1 Tax=Chryseobacterium sp. JJR-5R TaxID=3093923 RepID=UPI002A75764D|nr:T9SS type A sorting domain-containing protein [Chryseobacterium sp. JJR-5R]WPO81445.1 T9SS type A sorting domain-containing protein [Chryseobacterium sp. JJR-5R]
MTTGNLAAQEVSGEKQERKLKVEVVPNPVKDKLNLNVHYLHSDHIIVGLYEASGKFVKNILKDDVNDKGLKKYTLEFNYPKGNYLLDVHSNLGRQSVKVIKN